MGPMPSAGLQAESHESHPAVGEAPLRGHPAPSLGDGSIRQSQIGRKGMPVPLGTPEALRYPAPVPKSRFAGCCKNPCWQNRPKRGKCVKKGALEAGAGGGGLLVLFSTLIAVRVHWWARVGAPPNAT